jgi:benzoyl-CoA-dihydrodiol lyase
MDSGGCDDEVVAAGDRLAEALGTGQRVSLSPDALTGMEANLRYAGPETMETKIFGRLSAWQNWIFQRPNAVGERGALSCYGTPNRPEFDIERT